MCSQCNDASVLSMLDTVQQGDLYNTYNAPKIFLPLTSQFSHRIVEQTPQLTNVNNRFGETLTYQTALDGAINNYNLTNNQQNFLANTFNSREVLPERINTTVIEEPESKGEPLWKKCNHDTLGTILISSDAVCQETPATLEDTIVPDYVKVNDDALTKSIKKLQNIKIMIDNNEDINELGEYANAWVYLLDSDLQTSENILKFRETSNELLGMQTVKILEKNIILDKLHTKVMHIQPDIKQHSSIYEFLKNIHT